MVKQKRQKKLYCSLPPKTFFKVFLPDQSSHQMKFPPALVKYFRSTIPIKPTIISHMKSSWQVDILKINDSLYFQKGWEEFVQDNSLVFGGLLVFNYDGNAIFRVTIYGLNGCEKESTCHTKVSCHEISSPVPVQKQMAEKRNPKGLKNTATSKNSKENGGDTKGASLFKSYIPSFEVVMQPTYVNCGNLNVPTNFIRRYMTSGKQRLTLVYSDKSWPIKLRHETKFTGGWIKFARDNALKVGDTCAFQLIDRNNAVLKVSIFRC